MPLPWQGRRRVTGGGEGEGGKDEEGFNSSEWIGEGINKATPASLNNTMRTKPAPHEAAASGLMPADEDKVMTTKPAPHKATASGQMPVAVVVVVAVALAVAVAVAVVVAVAMEVVRVVTVAVAVVAAVVRVVAVAMVGAMEVSSGGNDDGGFNNERRALVSMQ